MSLRRFSQEAENNSQVNIDSMVTKLQTPPNFQQDLANIPPEIQGAFKNILHGHLVGIWPINSNRLLKNTAHSK